MKNTRLPFVLFSTLILTSTCLAADWPQWRGPNRDGKAPGFMPPASWPQKLTARWQLKIGSSDATPAVVGDRVYVFARQEAEEVLSCIDAVTGKVLWQDKFAPGVTVGGPAAGHPGPRSSPAVAEGKVVTLGVSAVVSCIDANTGKLLWRKETAKDYPSGWPRFNTACSPLIAEGLAIVQLGGQGKGAVVAYDLATGETRWKADTDGTTYSSPVLATIGGVKQVIAQNDRSLVGVALADGKVLWQFATPVAGRAYNAPTPIVDGNTIFQTGNGAGTRAITIERTSDTFAAKELWSNPQANTMFNTPILKDGMIIGLTDRNNFFCLDARTGKTLWTDTKPRGQRGFGSIVDAGPLLLALTNTGELIAFKAGQEAAAEVAAIKVSDAQVYAHPVLAGNRLFIEDQGTIAAYLLE